MNILAARLREVDSRKGARWPVGFVTRVSMMTVLAERELDFSRLAGFEYGPVAAVRGIRAFGGLYDTDDHEQSE